MRFLMFSFKSFTASASSTSCANSKYSTSLHLSQPSVPKNTSNLQKLSLIACVELKYLVSNITSKVSLSSRLKNSFLLGNGRDKSDKTKVVFIGGKSVVSPLLLVCTGLYINFKVIFVIVWLGYFALYSSKVKLPKFWQL